MTLPPSQFNELIPFLQRTGARPKKSLSQNFLVDQNVVRKTVRLAGVGPGDRVLEIGPGPGSLTAALLEAGAHVTAVEKDTVFARELHRLQNGKLEVIEGDFLELELNGWSHVIGNLPYHITTPILEKICAGRFGSFTFMVQKEFADRLAAKPGSKETSSLTIFVQSQAAVAGMFSVSASCFYPRPKVESTVVRLDFTGTSPTAEFFKIVRRAFQQRRKMLTSSLKELYSVKAVQTALAATGLPLTARPEELTLAQWNTLFTTLSTVSSETPLLVSPHS